MIDRVAKALSHPLRAQILRTLEERRASPSELSDQLGAPLGNVSYHVRVLLKLKLIKLVKKAPRRGAIEHYYEAVSGLPSTSDGTWARVPVLAKQAGVASALADIGRDVADTAAAGGFDADGTHLTRTTLLLDRRAKAELDAQLEDLLKQADRLQRESANRADETSTDADEVRAGLVVMLYKREPSALSIATAAKSAASPKTGTDRPSVTAVRKTKSATKEGRKTPAKSPTRARVRA